MMHAGKKVVWAEGVLLGQQHFQQWDESNEARARLRARNIAPLSWGLIDLEINEEALLNNKFQVEKATATFANGFLMHFDAKESAPLTCELKAMSGKAIEIYLCLPVSQNVLDITGYEQASQIGAWRTDYQQITDLYDIAREREVMFAKLNLMLLRNDQARDQFYSIKIAEIVSEGENSFRIEKSFIPTAANINIAGYLSSLLGKLIDHVAAKIRVLTDRRSQFAGEITEFGHSDTAQFLLLQVLNRNYVNLLHINNHKELHPERLFACLNNFIGDLSAFSDDVNLHNLPKYQHEDLTLTFAKTDSYLRELLEIAMPSRMAPLKLRRESDALYVIDSIDSSVLAKASFFIAVYFVADDTTWIDQFARQVKVGSYQTIEAIVASALPGVKVSHMQRPPNKLPIKSGYEYFHLESVGEFWQKVKEDRSLGIFLPFIFERATIELVTVLE